MSLAAGTPIVLHLGQPREQVFGVLLSMNASGVLVRGIAIGSVDDWIRQIASEGEGEQAEMGHLSLGQTFFPMHRVERISLDEPSHGLPSIGERFLQRTSRELVDWVRETYEDAEQAS